MTSPLAFLYVRRRRLPLAGAFFTPGNLTGAALLHALAALCADVACWPARSQRRNSRSLARVLGILAILFDSLKEPFAPSPSSPFPPRFPPSAVLCLRELYIFVYRTKLLLEYCSQSSRLWLLMRSPQISGYFHDLSQELATLLEVLPVDDLRLAADVREQIELLRRQCRRSKLCLDPNEEDLRQKIHSFLGEFETMKAPDPVDLRNTFFDRLGIRDARAGVIALTRYCRFSLFGFQEMEVARPFSDQGKISRKRLLSQGSSVSQTIPKDFCCPISLDLMEDPVVVSTGQTYDRSSITQWIEDGHRTCPNSGQTLSNNRLIPNRALRSLISQWCAAYGIPHETPDGADASAESIVAACTSKAATEANRATARILVQQLSVGSQESKAVAARELRLLAKTGKQNRLIVNVLRHGLTGEARENAAATLFSLSAVHDFKKTIVDEEGAVVGLANLLMQGSQRGKKDAVMGVAEEALGALALLMRQPVVAQAVGSEDAAIASLLEMMRRGTPKRKENAVAALQEMCQRGGLPVRQKVARTPMLGGLIQTIVFTGTKRARRKAALLARMCQGCDSPAAMACSSSRGSSFRSGDASVSMSRAVRVPVL
ncbi:U-box domain-containing protein [Musa troglodytarum]|uniref:RING-type E3 ubiquitin transferase n=1 Tax=Musa troglodytarum TaxID=320322 RepID=A0A9E7JNW7_9LILI|nr:U-box domain-containing protein [Musa troglodytarum]